MEDEKFMKQRVCDMTVGELINAVWIKLKEEKTQDKTFIGKGGVNFKVDKEGAITIFNGINKILVKVSLSELYDAVELSKERWKR